MYGEGPAARRRRAEREVAARTELERMRREREYEARLRREHEQARREAERRAAFERAVDEEVAALEREATLPLRERVREAMLAGDVPSDRRREPAARSAAAAPARSAEWWDRATTAQIGAAAAEAGYRDVAEYVVQHCPFGNGGVLGAVRARRSRS